MTKFVNSFATNQLLPPWESDDCKTWCFAVGLTEENVSKYLAKYFNAGYPDPGPYRYAALPSAQFGLIVVCHQPKIRSDYPEKPETYGSVNHTEVYFVIPVFRNCDQPPEQKLVWVEPFVFGDNESVLFASREVCGIDMTLAKIDPSKPSENGLELDVIINGIKKFDPHSRSEPIRCMRIAAKGKRVGELAEVKRDNRELAGFLKAVAGRGFDPPETRQPVAPPPVELNHLKQFRDVYDFDRAIYRAIVASTTKFGKPEDVVYYGDAKIDFIWSDSVAEMLESLFGFERPKLFADGDWVPARVTKEAALAFSFKSTVRFDESKTLYTYKATVTP